MEVARRISLEEVWKVYRKDVMQLCFPVLELLSWEIWPLTDVLSRKPMQNDSKMAQGVKEEEFGNLVMVR